MEIPFLMHNLNIWYELLDGVNTKKKVCGNLIDKPVYKCLIFTMKNEEFRGSISLNEINKIIEISNHLEPPFKSEERWIFDEKDDFGRNVIKNKYRVLDHAYFDLIQNK
jgi:hypothetical protein